MFSSGLQLFFWLIQVICGVPALKLSIDNLVELYQIDVAVLSLTVFLLSVCLLISQWWPNWNISQCSEEQISFAEKIVFSWLNSMFTTGYKKVLTIDDLPKIHKQLNVNFIFKKFYKYCKPQTTSIGFDNEACVEEDYDAAFVINTSAFF